MTFPSCSEFSREGNNIVWRDLHFRRAGSGSSRLAGNGVISPSLQAVDGPEHASANKAEWSVLPQAGAKWWL
ncbi:MAG: hypothetical protein NZL95_06510 [Chitinophagales bacterium]|nr:hypothetical protein [Chitinophagales bacterium]MDW8428190.1 hypothetical protein [Chitinophagales bacterium]